MSDCNTYPRLLDILSDLLDGLRTTVVVPLCPESLAALTAMTRLTPALEPEGARFVASIPQLAGIGRKRLGRSVADLAGWHAEIVAALDMLISGV